MPSCIDLFSDDGALAARIAGLLRALRPGAEVAVGHQLAWLSARLASTASRLLIIDGRLPDAFPALNQAKQAGPRVRVLFLAPDVHRMQQAFACHADDALIFPWHADEVGARMQRLLAIRREGVEEAQVARQLKRGLTEIGRDLGLDEEHMLARFDRIAYFHDAATAAHERRVARYAGLLARAAGGSAAESLALEHAAPLHDIGKVGIAPELLNKREKLSAAERAFLCSHVDMGYEILNIGTLPLLRLAAEIARSHHERFDGTGYPQGLCGERIPFEARVVALADVYDALTSPRPYKPAWDAQTVADFIRENSGTHFDPHLVDAFTRHEEAFRTLQSELSLADS
ncbi:HD domain-containing phosphohydrolase [uncultured Oxalicibacterium sp.]|uniref:HD-GYP domain-containing protein n=1 Tax=uncultured Oxalicibacterium sp. TaxID=1168540 RepID=UPI0025E8832F|nr:HD domain-containing phosphohydrolase [uncultured Oxalicibacterium sp.]